MTGYQCAPSVVGVRVRSGGDQHDPTRRRTGSHRWCRRDIARCVPGRCGGSHFRQAADRGQNRAQRRLRSAGRFAGRRRPRIGLDRPISRQRTGQELGIPARRTTGPSWCGAASGTALLHRSSGRPHRPALAPRSATASSQPRTGPHAGCAIGGMCRAADSAAGSADRHLRDRAPGSSVHARYRRSRLNGAHRHRTCPLRCTTSGRHRTARLLVASGNGGDYARAFATRGPWSSTKKKRSRASAVCPHPCGGPTATVPERSPSSCTPARSAPDSTNWWCAPRAASSGG